MISPPEFSTAPLRRGGTLAMWGQRRIIRRGQSWSLVGYWWATGGLHQFLQTAWCCSGYQMHSINNKYQHSMWLKLRSWHFFCIAWTYRTILRNIHNCSGSCMSPGHRGPKLCLLCNHLTALARGHGHLVDWSLETELCVLGAGARCG